MDSEKITVKYFVENEFCKEPYQASEDTAGYDLLAAETLPLFPEKNGCISLAFRFGIAKSFYGKIFYGLVFSRNTLYLMMLEF